MNVESQFAVYAKIAVPRELHLQSETRDAALRRVIGPLLFHGTGEEKIIRLWRNL